MKGVVAFVLGVFAVALAYFAIDQADPAAVQVMIGVVVGSVAMLPMCILLVVAMTRAQRSRDDESRYGEADRRMTSSAAPPVVVIQGGTPVQQAAQPYFGLEMQRDRKVRIVGDD